MTTPDPAAVPSAVSGSSSRVQVPPSDALLDGAFPALAPLPDEELAEIEVRAAAATDGPWHDEHMVNEGRDLGCVQIGDYGWVAPGRGPEYDVDTEQGHADAELVAHCRTDVPRLVAALRAAREDVAAHHADVDAVSRVLQAALGDRFAPDGPLADQVRMLVDLIGEAQSGWNRAEQSGGCCIEYGIFQDCTAEGLGHAFIATRHSREDALAAVDRLATEHPDYPAYAMKRTIRHGAWEQLDDTDRSVA